MIIIINIDVNGFLAGSTPYFITSYKIEGFCLRIESRNCWASPPAAKKARPSPRTTTNPKKKNRNRPTPDNPQRPRDTQVTPYHAEPFDKLRTGSVEACSFY
jgi:hypothetical protein